MFDRDLELSFVSTMLRANASDVLAYTVPFGSFTSDAAGVVYQAIVEVAAKLPADGAVNPMLVRRLLRDHGSWSHGLERDMGEIADAPTSIALGYMRSALIELHERRRLFDSAMAIAAKAKDGTIAEARMAASKLLDQSTAAENEADTEYTSAQLGAKAMDHFFFNEKLPPRLQVPMLSESMGRVAPGSLVVIGGQTGAGKSSLVLLLAEAYERVGMKPGIISLEDPPETWGERMLAKMTGVSLAEIDRRGGISHEERERLLAAAKRLHNSGVKWALPTSYDHVTVLTKMRRLASQGARVLFVDYLQQIHHEGMQGGRDPNRAQMMSRIVTELKAEAARLQVPLFLCSQISRPKELGPKWEPSIHSLKESGDVENKAEAVILLWKTSDTDDAKTLGKIGKLKSGGSRPRFEVIRSPAGAIENLLPYSPPASEPKKPRMKNAFGARDFE